MARFNRRGKTKYRWATAIADMAAPTRAEITASVPITRDISEVRGFSVTASTIPTPDLDSKFTKSIEGEDTTEDSGFTFYDDDVDEAIRTALEKGTAGFILYLPYGDVPGKRMEVWKSTSTGVNDVVTAGNEPATFNVTFSINDVPKQNAVVPAAV